MVGGDIAGGVVVGADGPAFEGVELAAVSGAGARSRISSWSVEASGLEEPGDVATRIGARTGAPKAGAGEDVTAGEVRDGEGGAVATVRAAVVADGARADGAAIVYGV